MYKFLSTKTVIHQNNSLVIIVDVNEINVSIKADHLPDELLIGRSRFRKRERVSIFLFYSLISLYFLM